MPLEQSTPSSTRRRWKGTRTSFVELVGAMERCMAMVGITHTALVVEIGTHEGPLASTQELRNELTEALWLSSRSIRVRIHPSNYEGPGIGVSLEPGEPVLIVVYHSGTPQARETLRTLVERALPLDPPDPRRHWRWLGPIFGIAFSLTWLLILSRIPRLFHHPLVHLSQSVTDAVDVSLFIALAVSAPSWVWLAFHRWFPPLECLPDTSESLWDRRRTWVQWAVGLWIPLVGILLALPATA